MTKRISSAFMQRLPLGWASVAVLGVALAGCSLVPEYQRPAAPVPGQFPGADKAAATAVPKWQDYFRDPELHKLIAAALEHNRDMQAALARVEEARALAGVARADRFPTVNGQVSGNRARTPWDLSGTGQTRISSRYDVNLGITAFELDFWGRVAALSQAARAQYLATDEAAKSFRISLISSVADTWFQLGELDERERQAKEILQNREDSLTLVRKRREAGLASDLDVLAAEGIAESVRVQQSELKRQRAQLENALNLLTGMSVDLPKPVQSASQTPLEDLAPGLPSEVLLKRPDVRAAEQSLIAANANIGAARAAFFPRISLTAAAGTASSQLSGLFDSNSQAWTFQPALSIPLFDAGRNSANLDLAKARKVEAVANYEKTVQQAFREVADALAARDAYKEQLTAQEANLKAQEGLFNKVKLREKAGVATYLEVLDASRSAFAAEQSMETARRQYLSAQLALYKALGGGEQ